MKLSHPTRPYRQVARAKAAEETVRTVMRAAVSLWREHDYDDITLEKIAERAGVSVQTVIRRFGSKQGLLDRCLREGGNAEVRELRDRAPVGDVEGALRVLLEHYERDGAAVMRTLRLEGKSEAADRILAHGRAEHRRWCARVFGPFLPGEPTDEYERRLDAFVGATDIYLWNLWRSDLGRSEADVFATWSHLLHALASRPTPSGEAR